MLQNQQYSFVTEIHNHRGSSYIPDVSFSPNGSMYAVTYQDNNEIRVYDTFTHSLHRTYRNPDAQLDWPHGVLVTDRHIIVSNKHNPNDKPSTLNVYRLSDSSSKPVNSFVTPLKYLREAHSFAIHNGRLLATYCGRGIGAILSYNFDDESGTISGPVSVLESWFEEHGEPKGVCFNEEGTKVLVTMAREKPTGYKYKINRISRLLREDHGFQRAVEILRTKYKALKVSLKNPKNKYVKHSDGVAIFNVNASGMLSSEPVQILDESHFCRLENVSIAKDVCAVANPMNDTVAIYNFDGENLCDSPEQVLHEHLAFPHDACLSPDRKHLVVSNYGICVMNGNVMWKNFLEPRSDKLTIFKLS